MPNIIHNQPISPIRKKERKYAELDALEVGESVIYSDLSYCKVSSAVQARQGSGKRFTRRTLEDNSIQVWRTK